MALQLRPKKWPGKIRQVTLGSEKRRRLTVGGANGLALHSFEAEFPHPPALGLQITDIDPPRWADAAREPWAGVLGNPGAAAKRAVESHGADLVMLELLGTNPDLGNRTPEAAEADVRAVLEAVDVPVMVKGPGAGAKQNDVLARVAECFRGEGLVLHSACQEDYKTLAAVAVAYNHVLVAESPIDLNIAKQVNILLADVNVDLDRVLTDPLTGALGYGLEYTYSVMERIRLAALGGDAMLNTPNVCLVGAEAWKAKEARVPAQREPLWGDERTRGIHWEIATALAMLAAGADVLVLRHPEALKQVRKQVSAFWPRNGGEG
jgi:acetyl-CoA decarbonylase/synthase, CODH/ACS complex subunit delta